MRPSSKVRLTDETWHGSFRQEPQRPEANTGRCRQLLSLTACGDDRPCTRFSKHRLRVGKGHGDALHPEHFAEELVFGRLVDHFASCR